jgi:hypothetical protein
VRVDLVQGAELTLFVPPMVGQGAEFVDFRRFDVGVLCGRHGVDLRY